MSDIGKFQEYSNCRLCGLDLNEIKDPLNGFCCTGCSRVYDVLQYLDDDAGKEYVEAARRMGLIPSGPDVVDDSRRKNDGSIPLPEDPDAIKEERCSISGMDCPSCSWVSEQILLSLQGVEQADVDFFSGTGTVRYDIRLTSPQQLNEKLKPLGYSLSSIREERQRVVSQGSTFDFTISAILTMNIMSLAFIRYAESLGWIDDTPHFLVWLELFLTVPVLLLGWVPVVRRAWAGLIQGLLTMDFLISSAVFAAFALSIVALFSGRDDIYFETASGLITISLLSRMIEARLRERAFADVTRLMRMKVAKVRLIEGEKEVYFDIDRIERNTIAVFREGEIVPFDGMVKKDLVFMSEAVLTGEPHPLKKVPGDMIYAGSTVVEGTLHLKIERPYQETRLYQITESISETLRQREGHLRSADRLTMWFGPVVLAIALGAWLFRLVVYGTSYALSADGWMPSVAVLAVACPCAFSLAGVAALTAAVGKLLKEGILVQDMEQLELLHTVKNVIFDKTGTLTEGNMSVERLVWKNEPDPTAFGLIYKAEAKSSHPVASSIRHFLNSQRVIDEDSEIKSDDDYKITDIPGVGRILSLHDGDFRIGSASLFDELFDPGETDPRQSFVWFGKNSQACGCFFLSDRMKKTVPELMSHLKNAGLSIQLLSGDRQEVCDWFCKTLHLDRCIGTMSLEDKVDYVRDLQHIHGSAFIGDGTNDALAMSEAMISVGLGKATDEALSASGFVFLQGDPGQFSHLLKVGKRLHSVIRTNYFWAFIYNVLFIPVAALGYLVPLAAMVLMLFSSTSVLVNSLRVKS